MSREDHRPCAAGGEGSSALEEEGWARLVASVEEQDEAGLDRQEGEAVGLS